MHLSKLLIISLVLQNVIKIPKYMVHKIAFCIELMRNKKKAKREMRRAKSGGVGR